MTVRQRFIGELGNRIRAWVACIESTPAYRVGIMFMKDRGSNRYSGASGFSGREARMSNSAPVHDIMPRCSDL